MGTGGYLKPSTAGKIKSRLGLVWFGSWIVAATLPSSIYYIAGAKPTVYNQVSQPILSRKEDYVMSTEKGSRAVADALKDIEVEKIRGPGDSQNVKLSSFWEDQPVVLHVLRRFGCQLCRGQSVEMAKMLSQLEANNVRVVGIGLEKFGLEEFEENNYWKSELYIDNEKKIHKALALTKVGWVGTFMMLFANKSVKEAAQKTKDTPGNFQGDGRQLGATFVMAKGGELLLDHRQKDFGDQPTNAEILTALGLDPNQA